MSAARGGDRARVPRRSPPDRVRRAWRGLPHERRLAAGAAIGLVVSLFLPWYQETVIARGTTSNLNALSTSLTGWGAFSFVEAAVLVVAFGVLMLLFVRAEGRAFHLPGGDGGVITVAGLWACVLIVWRMFDKQGTTGHRLYETTSGIEWGIFIALGLAALLAYAGSRVKLAHEPEPPLPGERSGPPAGPTRTPAAPAGRRARPASLADPLPDTTPRRPPEPSDAARTQPFRRPDAEPPTQPDEPPTQPDEPPTQSDAPRRRRRRRPHRALDFSELEQIEFDDPPEAPTVRHSEPDSEDPLTTRLDRPD